MTEADILATTYCDLCTIYRKGNPAKDPDTRQTSQEMLLVVENLPCALSTPISGDINLSEGHGRYQSGYTLFCRPETDIQAGDKVVATKVGRVFSLWAGRPFTYAGSHSEIPLSEEERT